MSKNKQQQKRRIKKLGLLLFFIICALLIFLNSIRNTQTKPRKIPNLQSSSNDLAIRGDILSSDNFKIATSKKLFKASIDLRCLDKDKEELFVTLFSLYSNIPAKKIQQKITKNRKKHKKNIILSYNISSRDAKNLHELKYKLRRLGVFKAIKINGNKIVHGLDIKESGEKRVYLYKDTLTPVVGYVRKKENKKGQTKLNGIKGIERYYNKELNNMRDGLLKGDRDILSYIIFNKDSQIIKRKDGQNIKLNIPLKLQRIIELILDRYKTKLEADEIIVAIMQSQTGKIITLASSNRFNPDNILQKDTPNLNVNAIEYQYEPGSVVKPISISLVIDANKVTSSELIYAHNKGKRNKKGEYPQGRYHLGKWTIRDDHHFKKHYITLKDIIIDSSNIGTLILAQRLTATEIYEGFKRFGLSKKTGIDLPYEKKGLIHKLYQYKAGQSKGKDNIFKATDSYGQGITVTFMQLLKAYSAFNNDGVESTPCISVDGYKKNNQQRVIKSSTANKMKQLLIDTVKEGTGKKADIQGLQIGGKTGTANVSGGKKGYQRKYISSFFGFVNDDKGAKYTIGVMVNNPVNRGEHWYYYYASNSAVPVFRELVDTLVNLNYLHKQ
jgi:cell division protein FtsI (penicillin-binding protein 3)